MAIVTKKHHNLFTPKIAEATALGFGQKWASEASSLSKRWNQMLKQWFRLLTMALFTILN
ncbi:hypothetical protein PanWU01x14_131060 [Parasponia andersonii]|uniref:Uncharacterized protein n=1 Tax=Parasponia andersonii TaxID=3476 RepID=A0A2P5CR04_PARAD|nr:hypothetical protein PanWU01x14_131060 [Parasponia andersonii]